MNAIKPTSSHDPGKNGFPLWACFLVSKVHGTGCDDLLLLTCSVFMFLRAACSILPKNIYGASTIYVPGANLGSGTDGER